MKIYNCRKLKKIALVLRRGFLIRYAILVSIYCMTTEREHWNTRSFKYYAICMYLRAQCLALLALSRVRQFKEVVLWYMGKFRPPCTSHTLAVVRVRCGSYRWSLHPSDRDRSWTSWNYVAFDIMRKRLKILFVFLLFWTLALFLYVTKNSSAKVRYLFLAFWVGVQWQTLLYPIYVCYLIIIILCYDL